MDTLRIGENLMWLFKDESRLLMDELHLVVDV